MRHVTTLEEPAQDALDDGAKRAVLLGEALGVNAQGLADEVKRSCEVKCSADERQLLDVVADEAEKRRVLGPPWPIDLGADLHAVCAGGRDRPLRKGRRPSAERSARRRPSAIL